MSFDLTGVTLDLQCNLIRERAHADNVLAWLPAAEPAQETLVIGAHYDHLGLGIEGSLAPKWGEIHNGADDNASGRAGVIELAAALAAGPPLDRSILFMTFTAEESGLIGSEYYVAHPVVPLTKTVAMVNLDDQITMRVSTFRVPTRSAHAAVGISKIA